MCARLVRGTPPTELKSPPMNQPPEPSETEAFTQPVTSGQPPTLSPVDSSSATNAPVSGPMYLKFPAR
jgi:hypothetical protein